uniref:Transposase Tnp1/En/Spm-like domain-containing protein n=1 Tax=Oryza punctata TaxID=4537 RepID=A0A0E0LTK5_ORYPU
MDHSSDEDMDVRQELRELKEPLKKHEKAIEEQQNKETCNGKSGPTKVNYERAYDGNVQEQAIRANRKAGITVILMTAKYPNKEHVAYATFLSSNPREKVGGVEIGNQFTKVVVNHPFQENEELVRPMKHCKTIGDVHAEGMSIAWPSICVSACIHNIFPHFDESLISYYVCAIKTSYFNFLQTQKING